MLLHTSESSLFIGPFMTRTERMTRGAHVVIEWYWMRASVEDFLRGAVGSHALIEIE